MIIVGFADVHGSLPDKGRLADVLDRADLVLLVGDITNFGREDESHRIVSFFRGSKTVLAVSGNCDFPEVDAYLNQKQISLHAKGALVEGIGFAGVGGSLITPFGTPNEFTEDEIADALKKGLADIPEHNPLVLVSHQPPIKTSCDRISSGAHVGSISVRKFIEIHQPLVCFTGHIHESSGLDKIGNTFIVNPGLLGRGGYAYAEIDNRNIAVEVRRWK